MAFTLSRRSLPIPSPSLPSPSAPGANAHGAVDLPLLRDWSGLKIFDSFERETHQLCDPDAPPAPRCRQLGILINISAGRFKFWGKQRLEAAIKKAGLWSRSHLVFCTGKELQQQAKRMARNGVDVVAIFGGDGSARTVALALQGHNIPTLPLPGGTLNRLCHRVHGHADMCAILNNLARAAPIWLSAGQANEHIFFVASGFGPWMSFHDVRETMRAKGPVAAFATLRALRHNLFSGQLGLDCKGRGDVVIAAPTCVDEAFGLRTSAQKPKLTGLEVVSARLSNVQGCLALGWAILTKQWRTQPSIVQMQTDATSLQFGGNMVAGLVDGEHYMMGREVTLTFEPRAGLFLSVR